jgi:hypothetical protein
MFFNFASTNYFKPLKFIIMKNSFKIIAVVVVVALFAALFVAVHTLIDTANAGLHFTM